MAGIDPMGTAGRLAGGRVWTWSACGLLIAVAVVLNQSAVHWRENVVDSHLFAYHGWCVTQGARPYVDIWDNKPPGIWWVNAAGFWLCGSTPDSEVRRYGEEVAGEVLISGLALTLSLVAFVALARMAYRPSVTLTAAVTGCVLLTHLFYECGGNRTETFVVACEILAILGYLCWWRGGGWGWLALAGLAAGAAPFFKQSGLAAGAACAVHLAWTQIRARGSPRGLKPAARRVDPRGQSWKPWVVAGGAFLVVPLCIVATLAAQGALWEAWRAVGAFNRAYFAIGDATWLRVDRALGIYWESIQPLTWLFAAAGIGLAWGLWTSGRVPHRFSGGGRESWMGRPGQSPAATGTGWLRTGVELFWLWGVLALYLACVGPGRRGHHFMPVLPALGLLALYPIHRLAGQRGLSARLTASPGAVALFVLFGYGLAQLAAGNLAELRRCWQVKPCWHALSYAEPQGYQLQAAEIRRLTQPGDTVYVWGWSPGTYRYAYRPAASRFATLEKCGQVGPHAQFILDGAIADIRRSPPKVLVFSDSDLRGVLAEPHGEFAAWLLERYEDRGMVGGMYLLMLREGGHSE